MPCTTQIAHLTPVCAPPKNKKKYLVRPVFYTQATATGLQNPKRPSPERTRSGSVLISRTSTILCCVWPVWTRSTTDHLRPQNALERKCSQPIPIHRLQADSMSFRERLCQL